MPTLPSVTGTDGQVPIYDPSRRFTVWELHELYTGGVAAGKYVPNVGDLIKDMTLGTEFKVADIDVVTLLATLTELIPPKTDDNQQDMLLGVGPGTQSDTYRMYLDKSAIPFTAAVDQRLRINGSMTANAKVFRGSDLADDNAIISAIYNSSGDIVSQAIPLELVAVNPLGTNVSVKTLPPFSCVADLADGELVTAVLYSAGGSVVSKRQLLVENTAWIRSSNEQVKYITAISIECPFLSQADPGLILLPVNVPLVGLNLVGVVHYSDGTVMKLPVDGTRFKMLGLDTFISTIVGQNIPLVLVYTPSSGEVLYGGSSGSTVTITRAFVARTTPVDGSYSVKLFGYPVWVSNIAGYTMHWELYSADRDIHYDVTGLVVINSNAAAFNPTGYGLNQQLSVSVNLQDVNGLYKDYRHVQTISIILNAPGTDRVTNWTIGFEPGQSPPYGQNIHAALTFVNSNLYRLKVDAGAANQADWLQKLYYNSKPIIDLAHEQVPPVPTHFQIKVGGATYELPVSQWNAEQSVGGGLTNNGTVFVHFISRQQSTDLQLAVAGLPLWQTN